MRRLFLLSVLGLMVKFTVAQSILQGKVISSEAARPVAYANIGIVNKNVGTLSNADGTFLIRIPSSSIGDTLQFSAIGFGKLKIAIRSLTQQASNTIILQERPLQLDVVTVSQRKEKNKTFELGNTKRNGGVLETDTAFAGRSIALLIDNREHHYEDLNFPIYLQKAQLRILKNNLPTLKFRIRINSVNPETGEPDEDILQESVIVESDMRSGWLDFDLSKINLIVQGTFFVTFEQILDTNDRTAIANGFRQFLIEHPNKIKTDTIDFEGKKVAHQFAGAVALDLPGTFIAISSKSGDQFTCFSRDTSFGNWERVQGIVTATVILSNQKPSYNLQKQK